MQEDAYRLERKNGRLTIVSSEGNRLMGCNDENSAKHYLSLLNTAFDRGFKEGYRRGRLAGDNKHDKGG